jgi:hypothetical protein
MLTMHAMKAAGVLFAFSLTVCATMPCFAQTSTQPETQAEKKSQVTEGLEVRIIPDKSRIVVGQRLTLRIEIWNTGDQDFYICRNLQDFGAFACHLTLTSLPVGKVEAMVLRATVTTRNRRHPKSSLETSQRYGFYFRRSISTERLWRFRARTITANSRSLGDTGSPANTIPKD